MATANIAELRSATPPARPLADMKPKEQIAYLLDQKKGELQKMLPKTLSIDRLLKVAQIAATTTPALAKCDVPSLVGAIGQCAQMGLEPNTVLGHAYLVPFNTKRKDGQGNERWVNSVQVIIGYKGLIDLARRSGQIVSIAAHEVCKEDSFELVYGLDEKLNHTPAMGDRGPVIGFYAVAKLKDGGHCFEFMSLHQVQEIMKASQGFQKAVEAARKYQKDVSHPWAQHFVEMGRKTVIRRLAKYLPLSIEFQTATALDEAATAGRDQRLDTIDGDFMFVPDSASDGVDDETGEIRGRMSEDAEVNVPKAAEKHAEKDVQMAKPAPAPAPAATAAPAAGPAPGPEDEDGYREAFGDSAPAAAPAPAPAARRARAAGPAVE